MNDSTLRDGRKLPPPFVTADFGALYTGLEFMMTMTLGQLDQDALHSCAMLLDKVRSHFIASGGDPKELEDAR
jgi:hypothetical protein